jgi:hypothetical protein
VAGAAILLLMAGQASFGQSQDSTIDSTQRLIRRCLDSVKDAPIAQGSEAGQVFTFLRSTRDLELIPVFERVRQSKNVSNQVFGMVSLAGLTKDPKRIDVSMLVANSDPPLVGSAIASLIDIDLLTPEQLQRIMTESPEGAHRVMAAGELSRLKQLKDPGALKGMLKDEKEIVRYYAATTLLGSEDRGDVSAALAVLNTLSSKHNLAEAPLQALMLVRSQKEKLTNAAPWAAQIAADPKADEGLRYTAVSALLSLKGAEGPAILADMINKQRETIQQVKLALISVEFGGQLQPAMLDPLVKSRSALVRAIGAVAQKVAEGTDSTAGILGLIKEGHPIVLDWAAAYADRTDTDRQLALRTAIVGQATIVDNIRDRDYDRAAAAAQRILDEDGAPGRRTIANLLKSDNRAVVEATLKGILSSKAENQSELVLPIWDGLTRTTSTEPAANFAAIILAREGHKEPLKWLPGMVAGGTVQGAGLRAMAGWYYAKLQGETGELLKGALAD